MANLDDIQTFMEVAQFESIRGGSPLLGMPSSTVSQRLWALESRLGVSLRRRTTQRLTLTARGRGYFDQCRGLRIVSGVPNEP